MWVTAVIRWEISPRHGRNGTANTATRFAVFGKATRATSVRWATDSPVAPIFIDTTGDVHMTALISLPRTMVSLSTACSAMTKSTMRRTATETTMETIIINPGLAAQTAGRTTG